MADQPSRDDLERTEEPTPKRREEARKKGQFAKSRTLVPAATLIALAVTLRFGGEELMVRMERCLIGFFTAAGNTKQLATEDLIGLSTQAGLLFAPILLPFFGAVVLAALGTGFLQTGFVLAAEPLHFDLSRVNPITGFRRLFSLEAGAELVKAVLFIGGLGVLGGAYLYSDLPALISLSNLGTEDIIFYASREGAVLTSWVVAAMGALAGLDYLYQRWRTETQLRMNRQEIKEEMREQEGDPQLKGRLKSLRQKMSRRRMTAEVAKADVVITNPTELAIALRYRADEMSAPRVLGKGAGYIAKKIREIAREKGIPIVENKPLARLLYRQVDVGQEIPDMVYRAVAEVLAYVYKLRRGDRSTAPRFSAPLW
jgi:flagellar biosynthetic protein FlhB